MNQHNPMFLAEIKAIADYVRAIDPDDDDLLADMLEGETDAFEVMDTLIERVLTCNSHLLALKQRAEEIKARKQRIEASADVARAAMQKILEAVGGRKMERPLATVSIRRVASKIVDGPIESLPGHLTRTTVVPDKAAIKDALMGGADLPGWSMSNGGETIAVKVT